MSLQRPNTDEFTLSCDSSVAEIIDALEGMIKDCEHLAAHASYKAISTIDYKSSDLFETWTRRALYLLGQKSVLESLHYALGGTDETEGPQTISIHPL